MTNKFDSLCALQLTLM